MTHTDGSRTGAEMPLLAPAPRTEPITLAGRDPVPVTLLTGFLGAGKTTLLNRILNGHHGLRVGVLVNDFGVINIDAALVDGVEENTIKLTNGCICCEIRDDLVDSLEALVERTDDIDYVIVEASGVAEPSGIVMTFLDQRYEQLFRLDSVTCLIDAEGIFAHADDEGLTMLKLRQIGFADLVVLNKTDLVGVEHVQVIHDWIALHMRRVRIVEASHGQVPLEILLAAGRFDPRQVATNGNDTEDGSQAHPNFDRWSYQGTAPFDADALREMVKRQLPESVYRCKGIIRLADPRDRAFVLQVVGRRTALTELNHQEEPPTRSEIVAIGRKLDHDQLDQLFDTCIADQVTSARS